MANYKYTSDLIDDVLFRAGEKTDGSSDFATAALRYLNRAYQAIWMGGTEFDPTINDTWWWLKREAVIIMDTPDSTLTVNSLTNGSTTMSVTTAPAQNMDGWYVKVGQYSNVYKVSHTSTSVLFDLDAAWTEANAGGESTIFFNVEYDLTSSAIKLIDPMNAYKDNRYQITATSLRDLENIWPLSLAEAGVPSKFAMVDENTIRFNRYGTTDATNGVRIDYNYLVLPDDLANTTNEEPLLPIEYRRLLSDIALFWIFLDKNDDRATSVGNGAKSLLKAMSVENRSRWANWGDYATIKPRLSRPERIRPLRTETGLIIG